MTCRCPSSMENRINFYFEHFYLSTSTVNQYNEFFKSNVYRQLLQKGTQLSSGLTQSIQCSVASMMMNELFRSCFSVRRCKHMFKIKIQ